MGIGDVVMFKPEGRYGKWFGGKLATIIKEKKNSKGKLYYRVCWITPVLYHGDYATMSSFSADHFALFSTGGLR